MFSIKFILSIVSREDYRFADNKTKYLVYRLRLLLLAISYVSYSRVNTKPLYSVSRSFNNANKKMKQCAIARVLCSELSMRTVFIKQENA